MLHRVVVSVVYCTAIMSCHVLGTVQGIMPRTLACTRYYVTYISLFTTLLTPGLLK